MNKPVNVAQDWPEDMISFDVIDADGEWPEHKALTALIAQEGQLLPAVVIAKDDDRYDLVDGRKRRTSLMVLGQTDMWCKICPDEFAARRAVLSLALNCRFSNPVSEARLIAQVGDEAALASGLRPAAIKKRKRLLNLIPPLAEKAEKGEITVTAALALAGTAKKPLSPGQQERAWAAAVDLVTGKKRLTTKMVRESVRVVLAEDRPQMKLPASVFEQGFASFRPDPVTVAVALRVLAEMEMESDSCQHHIVTALLNAAQVLDPMPEQEEVSNAV